MLVVLTRHAHSQLNLEHRINGDGLRERADSRTRWPNPVCDLMHRGQNATAHRHAADRRKAPIELRLKQPSPIVQPLDQPPQLIG